METRQAAEVTLRFLKPQDLPRLIEAHRASSHERDTMSEKEMARAFLKKCVQGLLLEAPDRTMLVAWQMFSNDTAVLSCLHRTGSADNLFSDCHNMIAFIVGLLKGQGVDRLCLAISVHNPNLQRLHKVFARYGFRADVVRMVREV